MQFGRRSAELAVWQRSAKLAVWQGKIRAWPESERHTRLSERARLIIVRPSRLSGFPEGMREQAVVPRKGIGSRWSRLRSAKMKFLQCVLKFHFSTPDGVKREKRTDKTYADNTTNAWNVNLNNGNVNNDNKTNTNYVLPVRGGE